MGYGSLLWKVMLNIKLWSTEAVMCPPGTRHCSTSQTGRDVQSRYSLPSPIFVNERSILVAGGFARAAGLSVPSRILIVLLMLQLPVLC